MRIRNTAYASGQPGVSRASAPLSAEAVRDQAAVASAPPGPALGDVASVLGIPEGELTPNVSAALDRLLGEVRNLRLAVERARKRVSHLETLADQDALTPALNRRAFVRELSRMMAFAERYKVPSSVAYFDVNGMKQINDQLGHAAGDVALQNLAGVLVQNVRAFDIVGRLGGDEFGVILAQIDAEGARAKAQSLAAAVDNQPAVWNGSSLKVSVAWGVHTFSGEEPIDQALHAADRAMYAQKFGQTPRLAST